MPGRKRHEDLVESSDSGEEEQADDSYGFSSESDQSGYEPDKVFCKCREHNTEDMIGCDGLGCLYEWLHYDCAGVDPKNIPKGKWLCRDCRIKQKVETPDMPSGQFVWPAANTNKENNSGKAGDPIMENSLKQAEVQHLSNLTKACDAVIYKGKSVSEAAQQFSVGRYVLNDYVNDQLKHNLSNACESVLNKTYSVQRAAVVFGVIPAILEERVKAMESKKCTPDCRQIDQPLTRKSLEQELQPASRAVSEELTVEEVSKAVKVPPEDEDKLQDKLRSGPSLFNTQEENGLVKLCIKLTVLGHCPNVKAIVKSKIKQLLDEEELLGIKRPHSFPDNMPDDLWWDAFRKRHPEFRAMDSAEPAESKEGVLSQSDSVEIPLSNSIPSGVVQNQLLTQPTNLVSNPSNVGQIVPAPQGNMLSPGVILRPLTPQSVIHNSVWNNNQCEVRPTPPTADKVIYILNTPPATTQQYILVNQSPLLNDQVTPVSKAGPIDVGAPVPAVLNRHHPECEASQSLEVQQESIRHNGDTENVPPAAADDECNEPNSEAGGRAEADVVPASKKVSQEDTEVADILNSAQENTEISEIASSEMEHPDSVDGIEEIILPNINVGSNEVVQTVGAMSGETSPASTFGDHELPQIRVMFTGSENGNEPVEVSGSDIKRVVANEVVETSSTSAENAAPSDGDVTTSEAVPPQMSIANEQPGVAVGVRGGIQTSPQTGLNGATAGPEVAQLNPAAAGIAIPRPNLAFPANQLAHAHARVLTSQVVPAQPSFIVQPTPIIVANPVAQPSQVILSKNVVHPNLVANSNQMLMQNYVVIPNRTVPTTSVHGLLSGDILPAPVVSLPSNSAQVGIPNRDLQTYLDETGGTKGTSLVMPMSGNPQVGKPVSPPQAKVFVAKHKVDKSLPDALTCLEETLTEEQREAFAFRLQIGDDRQDDAVYNAWRALKRLYHHKNIYSMYDKSPSANKIPFSYDVPMATKLLRSTLMDPLKYDDRIPKKEAGLGRAGTEPRANIVAELQRGRKRRRIRAVLERKEGERRDVQDARRFLEPWRYRMKMPGKRKRFMARYAEEGSFIEEDEDLSAAETESRGLQMDIESLNASSL